MEAVDIEEGTYDEEELVVDDTDDLYAQIPEVDDGDTLSSVAESSPYFAEPEEDRDGSSLDLDSEEAKSEADNAYTTLSWNQQVDVIRLRAQINELMAEIQDKENNVFRKREELNKCRDRLLTLEKERDTLQANLQDATEANNKTASIRLTSELLRNQAELDNEIVLQDQIERSLNQAEYELNKVQVLQGKMIVVETRLVEQEKQLKRQKQASAVTRLRKEHKAVQRATRALATEKSAARRAGDAQRERAEELAKDAEKSAQKVKKYIANTVSKMKQRELAEEQRQTEHIKQRMSTILSLKRDITLNKENLKALKAQEEKRETERREEEQRQKDIIQATGQNVTVEMVRRQRQRDIERQKIEAEKKEKRGLLTIMDKLNQENEGMQRKKKLYPPLFSDAAAEKAKNVKPLPKRQLKILQDVEKSLVAPETDTYDLSRFAGLTGEESDDEEIDTAPPPVVMTMTSTQEVTRTLPPEAAAESSVARPEFEGLWDKKQSRTVASMNTINSDVNNTKLKRTKMEQEIYERQLKKLQDSNVITQVAAGRKFTGQAFSCKPSVVCFSDLEVGQVYVKTVTLTNISYTVNHCKLTGLSECLKDFIELHLDPPGPLSAGMTFKLTVTFKPKVNEDLAGEVTFLSQTGPFQLPIKCLTKKCVLSVDHSTVDFGTSVVGECIKKTIVLKNSGALPTRFTFSKSTGIENLLETSATQQGDTEGAVVASRTSDDDVATATGDDTQDVSVQPTDTGVTAFSAEMLEELAALDGVTVGDVSAGDIAPFSSVELQLVWRPVYIGATTARFTLTFDDPLSTPITIEAKVKAIDVPVWVSRPDVDLQMCMYDRLYQDTVIVNNSASTALRLKFEVAKELSGHMEVLPKTGYIQAKSKFSAQLKFLPRQGLADEAPQYVDKDTGVLEVPVTITVFGQSRPVMFFVRAVVTTTQVSLGASELDLGHCTVHEKVIKKLSLTNHSLLPQEFGFVHLPACIDVQPNDGFGTLLPLETIEMDIIFQPPKADVYSVDVVCKTIIGREFKVRCHGVGVLPPLELSHQVINFRATSPGDSSMATIYVNNTHKDDNEFTHPVPRIGNGPIARVGPTSFEFVVPEDIPLTVAPSVGVVMPGESMKIQVRFSPVLRDADIREEAVRILARKMEQATEEEEQRRVQALKDAELADEQLAAAGKKKGGKGQSPVKMDSQQKVKVKSEEPTVPTQLPTPEQILPNTPEYNAAQLALLLQQINQVDSYTIACYVASGDCRTSQALEHSVHNTLYLQCHCPIRRPTLAVMSDHGSSTVDFGDVSLGLKTIKTVTVQNVSHSIADMHASQLDPCGPFDMINPLRQLLPQGVHTISLSFTPQTSEKFQEVLKIQSGTFTLYFTLKGRGISPQLDLSVKDSTMNLGAVLAGELRDESFQITNASTLSIRYCIRLESQSPLRHAKSQDVPHFMQRHLPQTNLVGVQNYNGQAVFDCIPAEGIIEPGQIKDITMTFSPDHASDFYSDVAHIELFGQHEYASFTVIGQAKSHMAYLDGGDSMVSGIESMDSKPAEVVDPDVKPPPGVFLITLKSVSTDAEVGVATREVYVGCARSNVGTKKSAEWSFDGLQQVANFGFTIEPAKGSVEAGSKRPITITWTPQPGQNTSVPQEAIVNCTLKSDVAEVFKVMLRGIVLSE